MIHRFIISNLKEMEKIWLYGAFGLAALDWSTVDHIYALLKVLFMFLSCLLIVNKLWKRTKDDSLPEIKD